jgi:DNA-binding HxlR family transcriptional regulator
MPRNAWAGYGRFCPLARALDVVGERWTLVIVQELLKRPSRYGDLASRLPGIGTSVLAYLPTPRGTGLSEALEALRRWGVTYLTDPTADGAASHEFDLHYVEGIDALDDAEFGLVVDGTPATLRFSRGHLDQTAGTPADPILTVQTSRAFMDRWAAGTASWDDGLRSGDVTLDGPDRHWDTWLAATGYLLAYDPEPGHA